MKHFLFLIMFSGLTILNVTAQDEDEFKTIFGGKEIGGYGSLSMGYSLLDTSDAFVFSARGGIVLGHTLAMGLGGSGFISEYENSSVTNQKGSLVGGYGGVFLELIIVGKSPVHLSVPVLAGVGGASYTSWINEGTEYEQLNDVEDACTFLVLEPGVELEVNITKNLRIAGYFSYRYTTGLELTRPDPQTGQALELASPNALNSYSAGLIFKFGKF